MNDKEILIENDKFLVSKNNKMIEHSEENKECETIIINIVGLLFYD